jgi:hypothetical protein
MTEPTAGDPFAVPPGAKPAAPPAQPAYPAPPPAQGYSAPEGYYPYGYPPQKKPHSWMNIVSLSAVAAGLFIPFLANIAGIVFGHLGRRASKRGEADYAGVGLAGLILNYIFAILSVLLVIAYFVFIVWIVTECDNNPNSTFCSSDYDSY